MPNYIFTMILATILLLSGLAAAIWPGWFVSRQKKHGGLGEVIFLPGYFFATERRARGSGICVALLGLLVLLLLITSGVK